MSFNDTQPRVPAGRRDGGQFTQADKAHETTDLTTIFGDEAFIDQIVAAGQEVHVSGISSERVKAYLAAVGRDDVMTEDQAAMRLSPWHGLDANGKPAMRKATLLTSAMRNLVEGVPGRPYECRLTEEGRRVALWNMLLEAEDRKRFEAKSLSFNDAAADACADFYVAERVAEATRNLGKPGRETFDLLATGLMSGGVEDFLTRRVPRDDEEYGAFARLGSSFEGTGKVGADFLRYERALPMHTAEAKDAFWDMCAKRRMEERLPDAWEAARRNIKLKFGVEPDDFEMFYRPKYCLTPLEYEPAEEDWGVYRDLRAKAKAGDVRAQATMAAFDVAVKNAGRHDATLLSDGRASTPLAKNRGSRKIVVPYQIHGVGVEGVRRGSYFVYTFTNGREYFEAGIAQFRERPATSLQTKVGSDDHATELGDLLAQSRGGSGAGRNYAGADEIYDAGQRYASASVIAAKLPDDDAGNSKLRRLLDFDDHAGITDEKARAAAIAKDITNARAEGMPESIVHRVWGDSLADAANTFAKGLAARRARVKAEAEAANARARALAAQRRAAQPAR